MGVGIIDAPVAIAWTPSCCRLAGASRTQRGLHRNRREARPRPSTHGENASLPLRPTGVEEGR